MRGGAAAVAAVRKMPKGGELELPEEAVLVKASTAGLVKLLESVQSELAKRGNIENVYTFVKKKEGKVFNRVRCPCTAACARFVRRPA